MVTIGRFAPTPSGPLHEGSLQTATASWLSARRQQGQWWLRIDDLDAARCPPGGAARILQQLDAYGLSWDGEPLYQSQHLSRYRAARAQLDQSGLLYPCDCTRAQRRGRLKTSIASYDQYCWRNPHPPRRPSASRLILDDGLMQWDDVRAGPQRPTRANLGDPVVWRQDDLPGYALACAVDERYMNITEVVRGEDLLAETAPQVQVYRALGGQPPDYWHLPLVFDTSGRKMSKQNHAPPLPDDASGMSRMMWQTLRRLGIAVPDMLQGERPMLQLAWARDNCSIDPRHRGPALQHLA